MEAFELMGSFVSGMIEQDQNCAFHRFDLLRNIQDSDLWREHLCQAGVQTRFRPKRDVERDAQQRLARSEANFAALQEWMEQRRHLLVSAMPLTRDNEGNRRWTFVYQAEAALTNFALAEASAAAWQSLAAACVVTHCTGHGHRSFTYLGEVSAASAAGSTYSVEFLLTPAFTQAAIEHPPLRDLLARIVGWLEAPSLPQ